MRSDIMPMTGKEQDFNASLAMTEKIGGEQGLDRKSVVRLRLLAEELFGMLRGIAGKVDADYYLVYEGKNFQLHMKADVSMTDEMRAQFIAASSSGKNDAARGFMGKVRVMIANLLLSSREALPYTMTNTVSFYSVDGMAGQMASMWTMMSYKEDLMNHLHEDGQVREDWDELEKSIVANIADDVKVSVVGSTVEISVLKSF
ncbi:MAG: hypothetical protein J6Z79_06370 [Clostridia bacterium]|nr:hypothetical protein [Clostridia bacterium]